MRQFAVLYWGADRRREKTVEFFGKRGELVQLYFIFANLLCPFLRSAEVNVALYTLIMRGALDDSIALTQRERLCEQVAFRPAGSIAGTQAIQAEPKLRKD
ncbi:MAG: hypothetical protein WCB79_10530 [Halobacteriota archaeon]